MQSQYDVVILGGGCSGLSLAVRLAELGPRCPSTLIVEQRTAYTNDRTWCFWDDGATRHLPLIQHRWPTMTVQNNVGQTTINCGDTPYQLIPAEAFYQDAVDRLTVCPSTTLQLGVQLTREPTKAGRHWQIETTAGSCLTTTVIDTRPSGPPTQGAATLWQSFSGQEVECDEPVFDPATINLMDFSTADPSRILFTYVLPLSTHRALIEVTQFGPEPLTGPALAKDLAIAISRRVHGSSYTTLRAEDGILPMGLQTVRKPAEPNYIKAGLTAGAARPCTGYAFQRIQRWADSCAKSLAEGRGAIGHPADPLLLRAMDHLFLSVLRAHPEKAPDIFLSLFANTQSDRMIRFLSGRGRLTDYCNVIAALPILPFLQQVPKALWWQESWR
ncbi:MAG: lycopene cyclase family protein [Acidobacteria bacterium]|nr:lycopene cyclase family protein [Acidobacteriota bacterium]